MEHKNLYSTPWKNKGLIGTNYVIVCSQGLPVALVPNVATVNKETNELVVNAAKQIADLITAAPNMLVFAKSIIEFAESGFLVNHKGNSEHIIELAKSVVNFAEVYRLEEAATNAAHSAWSKP